MPTYPVWGLSGGQNGPPADGKPAELELGRASGGAGGSVNLYGGDGEAPGDVEIYGGSGVGVPGAPSILVGGQGSDGQDGGTASIIGGGGDGDPNLGAQVIAHGGRGDGQPGWVEIKTDNVNATLSLRSGGGVPTAAAGFPGNPGSLYIRTNGELWIKTGDGDTAWTKIGP